MLLDSFEFLGLFLPVTLFVFFQIGRLGHRRIAITWLVAASLFFYSLGKASCLPLLLGSILLNYGIGRMISHDCKAKSIWHKVWLTWGLMLNLGMLAYFKYTNFLLFNAGSFLGFSTDLQIIALPLAISFFTFNQIAYLVDIYRGEIHENNFLKYCFFATFFPYLMAGPVVRYKEIVSQVSGDAIYRFNAKNIAVGLMTFSLGLLKKLLFANTIGGYADPIFDAAAQGLTLTAAEAWSGVLAYSLQIYFDFSGYSDMAIGIARIFGIRLPLNFDSPYKATNIIDFWRRWHISLSHFLRDYLYIPLGGNRRGELRQTLNLMTTMLLGGLWHGAGWNFVIWGGLHGCYLVVNHRWQALQKSLGHDLSKSTGWGRAVGALVTLTAVAVAWVFFRAENLQVAFTMLTAMLGANGLAPISPHLPTAKQMIVQLFLLVWLTPNTQQWMGQYGLRPGQKLTEAASGWLNNLWRKLQWQPSVIFGMIFGVFVFIYVKILAVAPSSQFVYFKF